MSRLHRICRILLGLLFLTPPVSLWAQVITDFQPKYGSPGDPMTIYGSGFQTPTIYVNYWNGIPLVQGGITSDSVIQVTAVPAGIITGPLSVKRNSGGWNYSAEPFTVIPSWAFIERVEPGYGAVGQQVVIHGAHFGSTPLVKFGSVTAPGAANGAGTQITCWIPSGAPSNSVITVTALGGTSTNPEPFTVVGAGPYIDTFTPKAGSDSTPVTLRGLHFTGTTSVKFNGKEASLIVPSGDIEVTAWAPSGVTTGPISITTGQGSDTTAESFYGPIRLGGFNPTSGPVGTQVVITGTNFTGATSVKFGGFTGVTAPFVVNNNNQITATVPTNASTDILVIATPAGSLPTTATFVVTPSITGFTPSKGQQGTPVQINGTRLVDNGGGAPVVKFNGINANVTSHGAQQVLVTAPASASGFITLTTSDGTAVSSTPFYYPPQITGFTPNASPPGTVITITGQSLTNASSVLFNGVPSTNVTVLGNTSLLAEVPVGFTTGPLTVTTPGGTVNSAAPYYAAPVITAFAPESGAPGTSVTVFGTSFLGVSSVRFNGVNASVSGVQNNQLTAVVPAGASTGPISLTAPAGTAVSAANFVVLRFADLRVNTFLNEPDAISVGEVVKLTIVPSNDGPDVASNVTASVSIPAGLKLKAAWSPAGGVTVNTNGNPLVFTVNSMIPVISNPSLFVELIGQVEGPAVNTVTLGSATFDPDTDNNTESAVTTVLPAAELSIDRTGTNQVRITWPVSLSNHLLQSTPTLINGSPWGNVATPPVVEGDERVVIEPGTGAAKFYRLKK